MVFATFNITSTHYMINIYSLKVSYEKAREMAKKAENTSDLASDGSDLEGPKKRRRM